MTGKIALSLVAVLLTLPLLTPAAEEALANFSHAREFSIAAAGFIGTVLVLAFTLSIIPVQRAAESMPVSVVQLFARDATNVLLFLTLAFLCLLSFCLALYESIVVSRGNAIPLQLLVIGIAFDLIRWHHRHTLGLLEPVRAVRGLLDQALRAIRITDRRVHLAAVIQWVLIPRDNRRQTSREQVAATIYRALPNHALLINQWSRELEEAALRAIEQVETRIAIAAIDSLTVIGQEYLVRRRHTLIPILVNLVGVYESDLREVLTPLYEALNRIGLRAIATKNEPVAIRVVQGLGRLATTCATLESRAFRKGRAPLAGLPLAYLERCALAGLADGLHDLGLEASRTLVTVSVAAPKDTDLRDVQIPVADSTLRIVATMLSRRQPALANLSLEDCLRGVWGVVGSRHYQADHYLRHFLRELAGLIPVAVAVETITGRNVMTTPLAPAYDLSNQLALPYLLTSVAQPDEQDTWNPYHHFSELSEAFHKHLRAIAENVKLGDSSLTWHFVRSISQMSQVYAALVSTGSEEHRAAGRDLAKEHLPWYLAFHWVCFSKMGPINLQTANDATESLGSIALSYIDLKVPEVVDSAVKNIGSITKAYGKVGQLQSPYDIGDLLEPLLCVERFATATGDQVLIQMIDSEIAEVMELFQGEVKKAVGEAVGVRRAQVDEGLAENWNRLEDRESPEGLLARMLRDQGLL